MKEKTHLLREVELGGWAKGCGVSFPLALVSIHCKLLRLIQPPASPPHQEHFQSPLWITAVFQPSPQCKRHFSISAFQDSRLWGGWPGQGRAVSWEGDTTALSALGWHWVQRCSGSACLTPFLPVETQKMRILSFVTGFQTWWQKAVFRVGNYYCSSLGAFSPGQVGDSAVNEDKKMPFTIAYMWNKRLYYLHFGDFSYHLIFGKVYFWGNPGSSIHANGSQKVWFLLFHFQSCSHCDVKEMGTRKRCS